MATKTKAAPVPVATPETNGEVKKTACPLTRAQFLKAAKPLSVTINGVLQAASVKEFSTGSFGWYSGGAIVVEVDGIPVKVQVGLNMTIANSKEAK